MEFKTKKLLHGGDYNPEQWLDCPDILEKDLDMLTEAGCNVVTLGVFSWSTLEPEEGRFCFDWLENIINKLYESGIIIVIHLRYTGKRQRSSTENWRRDLEIIPQ